MTQLLIVAFLQALATGSVGGATVTQRWHVVFVAAFCLNLLWWINIGNRIDMHGKNGAGVLYALMFAAGITLGAWLQS